MILSAFLLFAWALMQGELIPDVDGEDGFDEEKLKKGGAIK